MGHLTRVLPDSNEPVERCIHGVNYGFFAMLYRLENLESLRSRLNAVVWDPDRPHCLDVDVALASISDKVGYYAVPAVQQPGFLSEGAMGSARWDLNRKSTRPLTSSSTSSETSSSSTASTTDTSSATSSTSSSSTTSTRRTFSTTIASI